MQSLDPITWIIVILSVIIVSLISLVGVITTLIKIEKLKKILQYLVSLSAGTLIGGAFIHLIPEGLESTTTVMFSISILSGIMVFFILEKLIQWRHCHYPTSQEHPHSFAYMNLVGDGVHNFIDGLIIAGAFLLDFNLGIITTIAVILHEIPQEIGDFGVLIYGGFSIKRAIILNLVTALVAVVGAIIALFLGAIISSISVLLVPFAAGGFIYIGGSDLIPELNRSTNQREISISTSIKQLFFIIIGFLIMFSLIFLGI